MSLYIYLPLIYGCHFLFISLFLKFRHTLFQPDISNRNRNFHIDTLNVRPQPFL